MYLKFQQFATFGVGNKKKHQQTRPWVGNSGNTFLRDEALGVLGKKIPSHVCQKGGTVVQRGLLLLPYTLGYVRDSHIKSSNTVVKVTSQGLTVTVAVVRSLDSPPF